MSAGKAPVNVGTSRQLLLDEAFVDSRQGFVPTMNPAVRWEEPLLLPEKPWEEMAIWSWLSAMEDDGLYKMWYDAWQKDPRGAYRRIPRLCYATSRDGLHWERPSLGVVEFEGSRDNNIVFAEGLGNTENPYPNLHPTYMNFQSMGTVFKDPVGPPEKRFKFIFTDLHDVRAGWSLIYGAYSPDGIRWKLCKREPIIPWHSDTMNVCFWDDRIRKYVAYVRVDVGLELRGGKWAYYTPFKARAIGRAEGDEFENLEEPEEIMRADEHDDPNLGLYYSAAVKYPHAADAYFMFPGAFYGEHKATPDTMDVQLATSRDGIHFTRWREPFVRLGREGAFDSRQIYMGVGMVRRGDDLLMYYSGRNLMHGVPSNKISGSGGIGMVRIRLDGFVSQDAPASGGRLTTIPLRTAGERLSVNMDGSAGGWLKVEVLDEQGRPLAGFGGDEADVLHGNGVDLPVTWKGSETLPALGGRPVRLRFTGKSVKLYAFQFGPSGTLKADGSEVRTGGHNE